MVDPVRIQYFSDILCVWAYISQVRFDELRANFPQEVEVDSRYFHVFGNVERKIAGAWSDRGGIAGYAEHVRQTAAAFEHARVHPEVWVRSTPRSSMPAHLFVGAVRVLEQDETVARGSSARAAWALRRAFFEDAADVASRQVLFEVAEAERLPIGAIQAVLDDGRAQAALCEDLELARTQSVRSSPTLIFNEGRQRLTGNVGYRILEANIRELMRNPSGRQSWC